jgi:hypothetical protein
MGPVKHGNAWNAFNEGRPLQFTKASSDQLALYDRFETCTVTIDEIPNVVRMHKSVTEGTTRGVLDLHVFWYGGGLVSSSCGHVSKQH